MPQSLPVEFPVSELYRIIEERTSECLKSKVSALSVSSSMLDMTAMDSATNGVMDTAGIILKHDHIGETCCL